MIGCRPEGDWRSYRDGELPDAELRAMKSHAEVCEACSAILAETSARADRVMAWMDALSGPAAAPIAPRRISRLWAAVGMAAAAGVIIGLIATRPQRPVAQVPVLRDREVKQPVAQAPELRNREANQLAAQVPGVRESEPRTQTAAAARRPAAPEVEYFFALDDQPIELGVIQRVKLGPAEQLADVVFSLDGRARAIRLVSNSSSGGILR